MRKKPIVFIAFKGADNHGIGYMRAVLSREGFKTRVLDIRRGKKAILSDLKKSDPLLIGFSIIFQSHIRQFTELISFLKTEGVKCHFTAGGHYATLKYRELFSYAPMLDSVVRFEGEYTILELAQCINSGSDWKRIFGLAYMNDKRLVTNSLRYVEKDLDRFPVKFRPKLRRMAFNMKFATIIAGRGCIHNCSFCNTREYYRQMSGPARRNRSPEKVVDEMAELYNRRQNAIFRFDDDDFPVTSRNSSWIQQFCKGLKDKGLKDRIIWTINCRPDEIDEKNFKLMKEYGLFHVFIGIEDGTEEGLKRLNKNTRVDQNIKNVNLLKELGIGFDYGFMLFQPDTDFDSLNQNLSFLKTLCGDGYTPLTFLKLLPLYETRVEKELLKEGRLIINNGGGDYDFREESMNDYFNFVMSCLREYLLGKNGFVNAAQCAISNLEIYFHFFDTAGESKIFHKYIHEIISEFNNYLLNTLKELNNLFETGEYKSGKDLIEFYRMIIKITHDYYRDLILNATIEFNLNSSSVRQPAGKKRVATL